MASLEGKVEKRRMLLNSQKSAAHCPTLGTTNDRKNAMTKHMRWTPNGLMILVTASDGDCRQRLQRTLVRITNLRSEGHRKL